jgi:hypothetical protein
MTWNEEVVADKATVSFGGPKTSRSVLWAGVTAALCAAFFGYLIWYTPHRKPLPQLVRPVPAVMLIAAGVLVWRGMPGAHAGRITVESGQFRVIPKGIGRAVDVALAEIDYFAGSGDDQAIDLAKPISPEWDRFRVFVYLRDGRRRTVATFRDPQPALFMAQRLDALVERMRYRTSIAPAGSNRTVC